MGFLFFFVGRGGKDKGEQPRFQLVHKIIHRPSFWIMAILFTVSIGSTMGAYTMMPLFLVSEMRMERGWANTLISLSRTFAIVVVLFSGLLTDRIGPKRALMAFLTATGVFTLLLGLTSGPITTPILLFVQAAAPSCLFPINFMILSMIFPPQLRSLGVSWVVFLGYLFGGRGSPVGHRLLGRSLFFFIGICRPGNLCPERAGALPSHRQAPASFGIKMGRRLRRKYGFYA